MDLEIILEMYLTKQKTYPENSYHRNYIRAVCSLFFFLEKKRWNYDIVNKFRQSFFLLRQFFIRKYLNLSKSCRLHASLYVHAGFVHKTYNTGATYAEKKHLEQEKTKHLCT